VALELWGFWVFGFLGFWVFGFLSFGFWILDFGFWILDFGVLRYGFPGAFDLTSGPEYSTFELLARTLI